MAENIPIPNARPQNTFFHTDDWTPAIDNWFIEKLAAAAAKKNETLSWCDVTNIRMAMMEVNDLYDTTFSFERCAAQFQKLEERHQVFSFITSLNTVYYDERSNIVYAFHNYIWDYIVLKHPLGEAYITNGEPEWNNLCTIFGTPPHLNAPRVPEYVDLSSSMDNSVEIVQPVERFPRQTFDMQRSSVSVEIVQPVEQFPRQTFDMHMSSDSSSFWDDMAEFGYEAWSDLSVHDSQQSFDSGTSSFVTPPIIPKTLWPKPGSILIVDSPRPKPTSVRVNPDDDRISSTGSSNTLFDPLQRLGKGKRHG